MSGPNSRHAIYVATMGLSRGNFCRPHLRRLRPQGAKDWNDLLRLPALLQHHAG